MPTGDASLPRTRRRPGVRYGGFTLIELLVVLAMAEERALATSLTTLRSAIDQFAADRGRWPNSLAELAELRYVRAVPPDPLTGAADTWIEVAATTPPAGGSATGGIDDVRSGAGGRGSDGRPYADW